MAEGERREKVMLLTDSYRVFGEMRLGPDGNIWDFKHRAGDDFVTVYDAQCFRLSDGKRMYDATVAELSRSSIAALFRVKDLAFVRKENA